MLPIRPPSVIRPLFLSALPFLTFAILHLSEETKQHKISVHYIMTASLLAALLPVALYSVSLQWEISSPSPDITETNRLGGLVVLYPNSISKRMMEVLFFLRYHDSWHGLCLLVACGQTSLR